MFCVTERGALWRAGAWGLVPKTEQLCELQAELAPFFQNQHSYLKEQKPDTLS